MYLIFDTETTGLPKNWKLPYTDTDNWPRLVQLSWQVHDAYGKLLSQKDLIIYPDGFEIPFNSEKVHGISTERAKAEGIPLKEALDIFEQDLKQSQLLIAHNIEFDENVMGAEYVRSTYDTVFFDLDQYCTKENTTDFVAIPAKRGKGFKWPTLAELYYKLFGESFEEAHNAAFDVEALARCFFGLLEQKVAKPRLPQGKTAKEVTQNLHYEKPDLDVEAARRSRSQSGEIKLPEATKAEVEVKPFAHLQVHTHYSVLQSNIKLKDLMKQVKDAGMDTVAITDHGNLFGAFNAIRAGQAAGVKVLIGCELYLTEDHSKKKFTRNNPDRLSQQLFIAKNQKGYENLMHLVSEGWTNGYYNGYPRVDKALIQKHKEGLVAFSGSVHHPDAGFFNGELPELILNVGESQAEEALHWWKDQFGSDFYLQVQRHGLPEEERVNKVLLKLGEQHDIPCIATNNVFYLKKEEAQAQEILLCVKDAVDYDAPIGRGRGKRSGLPNHEYFLKDAEQMSQLFADRPEVIQQTHELAQQLESPKLDREILLPKTEVPAQFDSEDAYLRHLSYEGAKERFGEINEAITQRMDHELDIIQSMGFAGYFLIVAELIQSAKDLNVWVGPGRGSAAGSLVAFCTGITNIDPLHYKLLFERFLNPERVSMPDIDIDFEDRYRQKVIDHTVERYGQKQVAQIITYGTMAPKNAIRDVARTLGISLSKVNQIAKAVPANPGMTFEKAYKESRELVELKQKDADAQKILEIAEKVEGNIRNTGLHAAGIIIAPDSIKKYVPVSVAKESDLWVTQFDKKTVEDAGMLKMDILGLRNLSIIQDALDLIKRNHEVEIDIEAIPLDDPKTFELYQAGKTVGTFQFESTGMRRYLKELKPSTIEDLIAMNALYRPGPMQFIENFIKRKHGKEEVEYPHELLEDILKDTYGIMVYQEQIMQTAQILAGYSLGQADLLRRAMGKKQVEKMAIEEERFIKGAKEKNDIPEAKAKEIFAVMAKFAEYGFNRSHSAAYSVLAYQTAYLKAHYPGEYMASLLTQHVNNIDKITFFMEECRAMGLHVLGPDVNESDSFFNVTADGYIRFGLAAIKGAGDTAVKQIIEERDSNGPFASIFDLVKRLAEKGWNKKTMECLAYAGAFDCFDLPRATYFAVTDQGYFSDTLTRYASAYVKAKNDQQTSLFSGGGGEVAVPEPKIPHAEEWSAIDKLNREKEVLGFYLSGHPLDPYQFELRNFCTDTLDNILNYHNKNVAIAGIWTSVSRRQSKNGNYFAICTLEDQQGSVEIPFFGKDYVNFQSYLQEGGFVYLNGRVEERYNQPGTWQVRVQQIDLLSEIRSKKVNGIQLEVDIQYLNDALMEHMVSWQERFPGRHAVRVQLIDREEGLKIHTSSQSLQLDVADELLKEIEEQQGLTYSIGMNGNGQS